MIPEGTLGNAHCSTFEGEIQNHSSWRLGKSAPAEIRRVIGPFYY